MREPHRSQIRKACDLCYRKRIRCDGLTPRCSHCQIYSCQCTYQAPSRRKKTPKSRLPELPKPSTSIEDMGLDTIFSTTPSNQSQNKDYSDLDHSTLIVDKRLVLSHQDVMLPSTSTDELSSNTIDSSGFNISWNTNFSSHSSPMPTQMDLPAEGFVRQLIEIYLVNINSILPLFDPQAINQAVEEWYNRPSQRSRTVWAMINMIMANAQYCNFGQVGAGIDHVDFSIGSVTDCLSKAQSVLSDILMGDVELANLQVLLGLVIVFQNTPDIRPAVYLISTALRLCQLLGIHRSDSDFYSNATPREALQMRRVFWIAYILDRGIAMRIRQPPIQQDTDINIEMPARKPDEDTAGFVSTPELYNSGFNLFRAYVELSQIQGHVYDALFSLRSQQLTPSERAARCQTIRLSLKEWKLRMPKILGAEAVAQSQNCLPCIPKFLCTMYGIVVACLGQLCHVNSMDFQWIDQLRTYGRSITLGLGEPCLPPPQPQGWNALVNECREFMSLFVSIKDKSAAFIWMNICPYASGLVCLSANSIINFDNINSLETHDRRLKVEAVEILGEMARQTNHKTLARVLGAYLELDSQYQLMTTNYD